MVGASALAEGDTCSQSEELFTRFGTFTTFTKYIIVWLTYLNPALTDVALSREGVETFLDICWDVINIDPTQLNIVILRVGFHHLIKIDNISSVKQDLSDLNAVAEIVGHTLGPALLTVHPLLDNDVQLLHPSPGILHLSGAHHAHHINIWCFASLKHFLSLLLNSLVRITATLTP